MDGFDARTFIKFGLLLVLMIIAFGGHAQATTVRILVGKDSYDVVPWASTLALRRQFFNQTGIWVEFDAMGTDDTSRVSAAIDLVLRNKDPSIDIVVMDVVWTGQYAADLLPLQDKLSRDVLALHNEQNVAAGQVMGNLIAVPQQADYGLLYVRTDLLRKYGFSSPPTTMDQLGTMLDTIVPAERRSNPNFLGYIGQLKPPSYEGFMCNIMEMLLAESGGSVLEPNRTLSSTDLTSRTGRRVLSVAQRWNVWNRKGYLASGLDEWYGMLEFVKGNSLFHRNWPFVVAQLAQRNVSFEWQVAHNPGGAAALGGWMWGVSKHTRQQEAAVKVAEFLISAEFQRLRLVHAGTLPTVKAMYNDSQVCTILQGQCDLFRTINIAHRPSGASGSNYAEVSRLISMHWTNLITDLDNPPAKLSEHLKALNRDLGALLDIDVSGPPTNISPNSPVALAFESAAVFVILASVASMGAFIKSRHSPIVTSIGVQSLGTMIAGQIVLLSVVFTLVGVPTPAMCFARVWMFAVGCSLFVPTLGLRAFSIWSRSLNAYMSHQTVPTRNLALLLAVTISIDLVILSGFALANIPTPIHTHLLDSHYTGCGTHTPMSSAVVYSILFGYHGIQVVLALIFALSARRFVHLPKQCKHELNMILASLVNAVVVSVILVPMALLDYVDQVTGFALQAASIVAPMCLFSATYVVPKAWAIIHPRPAGGRPHDSSGKPMSLFLPSAQAGLDTFAITTTTKLNDDDTSQTHQVAPGGQALAAAHAPGMRAAPSVSIRAMPGVVVLPMSAFAAHASPVNRPSAAPAPGALAHVAIEQAVGAVDFGFGRFGVLSVRRAPSRRVLFLRPWRMVHAYLMPREGSLVVAPVTEAAAVLSVPLERVERVERGVGAAVMRVELVGGECIEFMAAGEREVEAWVGWVQAACQVATVETGSV